MYKIITLKANAKEIVTLKCIWHQIGTKSWYFEDKCSESRYFKMHLAPNMYKIGTWKANVKKIITVKCIWHQICTKSLLWRQTLKEIVTLKCIWHQHMYKICYFEGKCSENQHCKRCIWHQICTKMSLWRQMLRTSLLENACGTTYVQNYDFEGKCSGNCYLKMHLTPHMYKIITL